MFPYVEYILYRLKKILLDNYNTYYDKVNEHANNVYTNQLNEPDLVMEELSHIEDVYIGDNDNMIDNFVRNYIMIFPLTNYELGPRKRATVDPRKSLHISIELVIGDEDPEKLINMLFRHTAALRAFLLENQGFAPNVVTSMNINSFQFYNMILTGNVYTRAVKFNLILYYISGELE